jgi:hypothetical protein
VSSSPREGKQSEAEEDDAVLEDDDRTLPFLTRLIKWRVPPPDFYTQDDPMTLETQARDITVRPISQVPVHIALFLPHPNSH